VKQLPGVPGVLARNDGTFEVHRTHLPLLRQLGVDISGAVATDRAIVTRAPPAAMPWRAWQRRALEWAAPRHGTMIVAEPRMGKTRLALALHDAARGPLIILAPLDVRAVWLQAIETMFPGADVFCMIGRKPDVDRLRHADFVFGHYDIVRDQQLAALAAGTLIIDEAHLIANDRSRRSAGVRDFAVLSRRNVVLTGTPLWNSTKGLWPLLAAANPGAWGTSFHFKQRYCSPTVGEYGWIYGEISNTDEWCARRDEVAFLADWATERPDLPATVRRFVDVPLDAAMYGELDIAAESLRDATVEDTTIGSIGRYRKLTGRLKISAVAAAIHDRRHVPLVAWCWHKDDVAKVLAKAVRADDKKRPVFLIHGDESAPKRAATLDAWRATPDGVLVATLAVGQVGIDLSHASVALFVEVDWTPAVLYQAAMRTFTPDRPMELIFFRVEHPVELLLVDKLTAKLARGAASSMPAAGSGFDLSTSSEDAAGLMRDLEALLLAGSRPH